MSLRTYAGPSVAKCRSVPTSILPNRTSAESAHPLCSPLRLIQVQPDPLIAREPRAGKPHYQLVSILAAPYCPFAGSKKAFFHIGVANGTSTFPTTSFGSQQLFAKERRCWQMALVEYQASSFQPIALLPVGGPEAARGFLLSVALRGVKTSSWPRRNAGRACS
jgi:hypothetical protein